MKKIIILSSVLLIAIVFIAVQYFSELSGNTNSSETALKHIPADASLIIKFNNEDSFYDIFKDYEPFDAIIGENRSAELSQLNEILLQQAALRDVLTGSEVFISLHQIEKDSVDLLLSLNLSNDQDVQVLKKSLAGLSGVAAKEQAEDGYFELSFHNLQKPFYLYLNKGAALGSFSKKLMDKCVDKQSEKISKEFIAHIDNNSNKNLNSPVALFVDHHRFPAFTGHFVKGKLSGNAAVFGNMNGLTSLSMNFKSDALMFNGINKPDTTLKNYLNLFLDQQPVENGIKALLPVNTANFLLFGLSDYDRFHARLKRNFDKAEFNRLENQIKHINSKTGLNIEQEIKQQLGNEFMLIETAERESLAIIKLRNGRDMSFALQSVSRKSSEHISQFNHSNLLYYFFGGPFKNFTRPYFSITDNYIIVANSQGAITRYMTNFTAGRFLAKTKDYVTHDQLVANKSNVLYFVHNQNSERLFRSRLKSPYYKVLSDERYGLKNFYGFSCQWSSAGEHFQTSVYANYNASQHKELKPLWEFKLNARLDMTPQVFKDSARNVVIVQDYVNNIYAISEEGEKIWAFQLESKIQGPIRQLNDRSLLFNTREKLHKMKLDGSSYPGFPVSLSNRASGGMAINHSDTTALKVFIPSRTRILAFDNKGKAMDGWDVNFPSPITGDLKAALVERTDYLIAGTNDGAVYFYNMNGSLQAKVEKDSISTPFKDSPIILDQGDKINNSSVVRADTSGTVHRAFFNGNSLTRSISGWNNTPRFDYFNVTGDDNPEYVYLTETQLNVYYNDGTPAFSYGFEQRVEKRLQFFKAKGAETVIGVASAENQQLYAIDSEGNLLRGFPVKGTGEFYIGLLKNDGLRYVICGTLNQYLRAYKL